MCVHECIIVEKEIHKDEPKKQAVDTSHPEMYPHS